MVRDVSWGQVAVSVGPSIGEEAELDRSIDLTRCIFRKVTLQEVAIGVAYSTVQADRCSAVIKRDGTKTRSGEAELWIEISDRAFEEVERAGSRAIELNIDEGSAIDGVDIEIRSGGRIDKTGARTFDHEPKGEGFISNSWSHDHAIFINDGSMLEGIRREVQLVVPFREGAIDEVAEAAYARSAESSDEKSFFKLRASRSEIRNIRSNEDNLITESRSFGVILNYAHDAGFIRTACRAEDESSGLHDTELIDEGINRNHDSGGGKGVAILSEGKLTGDIENGLEVE